MYLISGCLLGHNCKYNGGNNRSEKVVDFASERSFLAVCPEGCSGLPVPRPPAEFAGERIVDREGRDVTEAFRRGAELSLRQALEEAERRGEKSKAHTEGQQSILRQRQDLRRNVFRQAERGIALFCRDAV